MREEGRSPGRQDEECPAEEPARCSCKGKRPRAQDQPEAPLGRCGEWETQTGLRLAGGPSSPWHREPEARGHGGDVGGSRRRQSRPRGGSKGTSPRGEAEEQEPRAAAVGALEAAASPTCQGDPAGGPAPPAHPPASPSLSPWAPEWPAALTARLAAPTGGLSHGCPHRHPGGSCPRVLQVSARLSSQGGWPQSPSWHHKSCPASPAPPPQPSLSALLLFPCTSPWTCPSPLKFIRSPSPTTLQGSGGAALC